MPLPPGVTLQNIDGGPTWYADNGYTVASSPDSTMSGAGALSWDNPAFFPIAVDYGFYPGNSTATFKALGLNTVHRVTSDVDLSALHTAGIWVWRGSGDTPSNMGGETCAYHIEEPGDWAAVTSQVATFDGFGLAGRFIQMAGTWNEFNGFGLASGSSGCPCGTGMPTVVACGISTTTGGTRHINIGGDDIYYFAGSGLTGGGGSDQFTGGTTEQGSAGTADQMARGTNYGDSVDLMRQWFTTNPAPVIGPYIETADGLCTGTGTVRNVLPAELNWAVWASVIHGARGILYFGTTTDEGPYLATDMIGFSTNLIAGQTVTIAEQGTATNGLVANMAKIINSPFAIDYVSADPAAYNFPTPLLQLDGARDGWSVTGIDVMAKYYTGGAFTNSSGTFKNGFYIFATYRGSETATNVSATFTTADSYTGPVTAINADGGGSSYGATYTLTARNGVFTDTFAAGSSVRIYQIEAPVLVQDANTNHAFSSGNTVITPGAATTAGNLLVVAGAFNTITDHFSITDSSGTNTWTIGTTNVQSQNPPVAYDSPDELGAFIAWCFDAASVTTVTISSSGGQFAFYALDATLSEWSGLSRRADSSAASSATGTIEPPAVTLASASDIVIAAAYEEFSSTLTPGAGSTAFTSDTTGYTVYAEPGSAGPFQPNWGASGHPWGAAAAAFTNSSPPPPGGGTRRNFPFAAALSAAGTK